MSKIAIIAIVAIAILLVGASVVFAQTGPGTFGGRMMQAPGPSGTGPMMGGSWEDMQKRHEEMGQYVPEEMRGMHEAMGEAMKSGDMQQMHETCQNYWQNQGGTGETPETPQTPPTRARGMMGGGSSSI